MKISLSKLQIRLVSLGPGISASQNAAVFRRDEPRDRLVPGQAGLKNCPFSSGRRDFSFPPLGSWTSYERLLHKNGALWADPYPKSAPLVTVWLQSTSKNLKTALFRRGGGI